MMIRLIKSRSILLIAIGLGLFFWFVETTIHAFIMNDGSFIQELFPLSDQNEIRMRLVILGIIFLVGVYCQSIINLRKRAEAALQEAKDELETRVRERTAELVEANEQLQREVAKRKYTKKALQKSERNLRATVMASPLPVVAVNPEGRVTLWNSAAERVFGWSEQEVLGKPYPIVPTDKWDEHSDYRKRAFEGETFTGIELLRQKKDGTLIHVRASTAPVFEDEGSVNSIVAVLEDVTERRQAEEALQAAHDQLELRVEERTSELVRANERLMLQIEERKLAEEKFRLVTENIQDVFWMSTPGIGEMIYVSPAYEKIYGRTQESLYKSPKSFTEAIHPEDRERVLSGVKGHAEGVWDFEYRIIQLDGSVRWVRDRGFPVRDEQGNLYRVTGVVTDITESKRAEEQILRTMQMLQAVFDGISDPLVMLDQNLSVRMVNKAAVRYYQITEYQAVVGQPCYEAFKGRFSPCDGCIVPARVVKGGPEVFERKSLFDPSRLEQVAIYPLQEVPGGLTGCILRISDVTAQKDVERQLARADRLSSLGQLSGGIAHEIRNPLSGISLFLDVLFDEDRFERSETELEIFQDIKNNINKIDGIIKRILNLAKKSDGFFQAVDVNHLIRENLRLWHAKIRKAKIKLKLSLEENLPAVFGDAVEIQQVVNNLVQNALEAMDKDGVLSVTTHKRVSAFHEGRPVVAIQVQDTGSGVPQEVQEKIFNPFFTTKSLGIGLGLSISHQIVAGHGGVISFDSKPGRGTTFTVEVPVLVNGKQRTVKSGE